MIRALFITYENEFSGEITTETRLISQPIEDLLPLLNAPDNFQLILSHIVKEEGSEALYVGFMYEFDLPDSISVHWEKIPTDFLLKVTVHNVEAEIDPEHDTIFPVSIGRPVMTLFPRPANT